MATKAFKSEKIDAIKAKAEKARQSMNNFAGRE